MVGAGEGGGVGGGGREGGRAGRGGTGGRRDELEQDLVQSSAENARNIANKTNAHAEVTITIDADTYAGTPSALKQ